jgi:hypothetical protein
MSGLDPAESGLTGAPLAPLGARANRCSVGSSSCLLREPDFHDQLVEVGHQGQGGAGDYLRAGGRIGPFGYSASEIAGLSARWRNLADVVLAHAGGLTVRSAPPSAARRCRRLEPTSRGEPVAFFIDDAVSVGSATARPVEVAARLFGSAPFRVGLASSDRWLVMEPSLQPGLPHRWEAIADSAASVCSAGTRP